ncbi:MAG: EF-P lysine aminoacylase GenX [Leptospira sp.]|nr:EF-P lysine aminoacylase GenX [Leptospira sp.]
MNLLSLETQKLRSKYLTTIRRFFEKHEFLEMDTPIMKKIVGMEPYLDPFLVHSPSHKESGYLITSPEYSLKMLLASGMEKIYEIAHTFRSGEEGSPIHSPEFLMLEFYAVDWDEFQMMDWIEELLSYLNKYFHNFNFNKKNVVRRSNAEIFLSYTGRSWKRDDLILTLKENRITYQENDRYEDLYFLVFLNLIEPKLPPGILFLYDYPPECSALAKVEKGVARRFEIYWDGVELANAFFELTDSTEQRKRFREEQELRKSLGKEVFPIDEDFLGCMEIGIPECTGVSIGLDRLLMKILGKTSLRETSPYT